MHPAGVKLSAYGESRGAYTIVLAQQAPMIGHIWLYRLRRVHAHMSLYTCTTPLRSLQLDGGKEAKIFDLVLKMNGAQSGATPSFFWWCIVAAFMRPLISALRISCTSVELEVVTVDREGL